MSPTVPAPESHAVVADKMVLRERLTTIESELAAAERRIAWLARELFGAKSEKRRVIDPAVQAGLVAGLIETVRQTRPAPRGDLHRQPGRAGRRHNAFHLPLLSSGSASGYRRYHAARAAPARLVARMTGLLTAIHVAELTPRLWKQHVAENLLRSDIDRFGNHVSE